MKFSSDIKKIAKSEQTFFYKLGINGPGLCTKNNIAYHRGSCYCHPCLKQKDLLKYNPYFEAMKHSVDDAEKTYLQNQISSDENAFSAV